MIDDKNPDRKHYDNGYSLGVVATKRDAIIPRLIGYGSLFGVTLLEPAVAGVFLGIYTVFMLFEYRDRRDKVEHLQDRHNPGPTWEWQRDE